MSVTLASSNEPKAVRHPFLELMARYGAILKASWDRRDELAGPRRMLDERAFLPAAIALQETPPHPAPRRALIAICALFTIALLWACFGRIDIVAVGQGRIIVSQRSKTIQPLETSVVKAIHVKDGDKVKAGDLLIELDSTLTAADSIRVAEERSSARAESIRSRALLLSLKHGGTPKLQESAIKDLTALDRASLPIQLRSEWDDISAKLSKLQAEAIRRRAEIATAEQLVTKLQNTLPLAEQREKDFRSLTDHGFVSGHARQDRTRERIELERDLATAQARLLEVKAALIETEQGLNAYRAETLRMLQDREVQADLKTRQLAEEGAKADRRNALNRLVAPVSGTVQQLAVHTSGGVARAAEVLLVLVPDEAEVTAEVLLENKDVGFLRAGQAATIKLETFPYTRYGTVAANVQSISADAVQDEKRGAIFPAYLTLRVSTINVDGKKLKITPGMNIAAEIKTGRRRVIEYLLNPIAKHLNESLKER